MPPVIKRGAIMTFEGCPDLLGDGYFKLPGQEALRKKLLAEGLELHTFDMYDDLDSLDFLIFLDVPHPQDKARRDLLRRFHGKRIVFLYECPAILPRNYFTEDHKRFDYVFTWNPDLVDGKSYFHFLWPQRVMRHRGEASPVKEKFLVMVAGNKMVRAKHELYSARRNAAHYFGRRLGSRFDLFGQPRWDQTNDFRPNTWREAWDNSGWEGLKARLRWSRPFTSYRGAIDDKLATLAHYRFCVCYENMSHIKGYVTEKIWDCFSAGTVPIYWGADDITEYIPKECFVDRRDFPSNRALLRFVTRMGERRYGQYLANIDVFLGGDKAKRWLEPLWGEEMGAHLAGLINQ